MTIAVEWRVADRPLDDERVREIVRAALAHGGREGIELSVALTGDEELAELHDRFLDDPSPTDVISFDLGTDQPGPAGEVVASVERARAVAAERGVDPARELALYLVHGTLHLCGYDDHDEEPRQAMRAAERAVLHALGFAPDPLPHEREGDS